MAQTRESLARKLSAARDLQGVVGTMKGLAAVTIRQYELALAALDDYRDVIELGLRVLLTTPLAVAPDRSDGSEVALVAFGSQRGLCGAINRRLAASVSGVVRRHRIPEDRIAVNGRRLAVELAGAGIAAGRTWAMPGTAQAITRRADDVLVTLDHWRARGVRRVLTVSATPVAGQARYDTPVSQLVPLDPARLIAMAGRPWPSRRLPAPVGDAADVGGALTRTLLTVDVHRLLAETAVAVHSARLAAMQAAERSIEDRLEELQRRWHQVRQTRITEDLRDIVSGFEALRADERRWPPGGATPDDGCRAS